MTYDANLAGVARRMQDNAQMGAGRFLFQVGELLEHIQHLNDEDGVDETLLALSNAVAFCWLLDGEVA